MQRLQIFCTSRSRATGSGTFDVVARSCSNALNSLDRRRLCIGFALCGLPLRETKIVPRQSEALSAEHSQPGKPSDYAYLGFSPVMTHDS